MWALIQAWGDLTPRAPPSAPSVDAFWDALIHGHSNGVKRAISGKLVYTWWGVWKERNRRIFKGAAMQALGVALLIWEDIRVWIRACSADPEDYALFSAIFYFLFLISRDPPWIVLYSSLSSNRMTGIDRRFPPKKIPCFSYVSPKHFF